jgi:hypothetical protein
MNILAYSLRKVGFITDLGKSNWQTFDRISLYRISEIYAQGFMGYIEVSSCDLMKKFFFIINTACLKYHYGVAKYYVY